MILNKIECLDSYSYEQGTFDHQSFINSVISLVWGWYTDRQICEQIKDLFFRKMDIFCTRDLTFIFIKFGWKKLWKCDILTLIFLCNPLVKWSLHFLFITGLDFIVSSTGRFIFFFNVHHICLIFPVSMDSSPLFNVYDLPSFKFHI